VPSPIGSMPVMISVAPQFWHLRLSMIFSGLGINWGWGMGSSCFRRERYRALSHRRLAHRAESVMAHVQHLSFESLVKMDHFQKEPLLDLRRTTGAHGGGRKGPVCKGTDRKSRSDWMSALGQKRTNRPGPKSDLSAIVRKRTKWCVGANDARCQ